jgi:Rad3-related DNA helicase
MIEYGDLDWDDEDPLGETAIIPAPEEEPSQHEQVLFPNAAEMDSHIRVALGTCLNFNPLFRKDETLIITLYSVLKSLYIEKKPYVLLSAPTGTGKSIIGDMIHYCTAYLDWVMEGVDPIDGEGAYLRNFSGHSYFLTSSKALQEQLEQDFDKFDMHRWFSMLKGTSNYLCTLLTEEEKVPVKYPDRYCLGMKRPDIMALGCYDTCPYIQKRFQTSEAGCAVLNYAYFINIMKMKQNPYFGIRPLTICDEAHLVPDIVLSHFNLALTQWGMNRIYKIFQQVEINFKNAAGAMLKEGREPLMAAFKLFSMDRPTLDDIREHVDNYLLLVKWLAALNTEMKAKNETFKQMFDKEVKKIVEEMKGMPDIKYLDELALRPDDLFIESEFVTNSIIEGGSYKTFRHTVYDMNEAEMCRKHFLTKVDRAVFMSATLGNVDEFALLMGMKKEEYSGFRLASNFNFDKSPIYLTKSGYLNYSKFNENIHSVLLDAIKVAEKRHPKEKGIIHTSTFQIAEKLKEAVYRAGAVTHPHRYLFYTNSAEKEEAVRRMKDLSSPPYVIVGPSLYEGLDLSGDMGRFNIVVKAPYSGLTEYTKKKMDRFAFWYERQTLEKLVQAIGRTNRFVEDWSVTYLLDSSLEKLIFKTQDFITKRVTFLKL